jgi:hypothetical protein
MNRQRANLGRTLLWLLLLAGCAPRGNDDESFPEAKRQVELARTLEAAGDKREAAHEYTIVAEQFPGTSYQGMAARRAGMLYADPASPARHDSLAIYWLKQSLRMPGTPVERTDAEACLRLLEQGAALRAELGRLTGSQDSLSSALRRQVAGAATSSRRISELETELEQIRNELSRLKQIDARARSRRKP